jgi:hypothetical protein
MDLDSRLTMYKRLLLITAAIALLVGFPLAQTRRIEGALEVTGGMKALSLASNTTDGADTGTLYLAGGGAQGGTRGGYIELHGNEAAAAGDINLVPGGVAGAQLGLGGEVVFTGTIGGTVVPTGRINSATLQPGFFAYNSSNDTGQATGATIDVDTERYDNAANFAADTFTAPVTGEYLLCGHITAIPVASSQLLGVQLEIAGTSAAKYALGHHITTAGIDTSTGDCVFARMTVTDTAFLTLVVPGTTATVLGLAGSVTYTYFSGRLVP